MEEVVDGGMQAGPVASRQQTAGRGLHAWPEAGRHAVKWAKDDFISESDARVTWQANAECVGTKSDVARQAVAQVARTNPLALGAQEGRSTRVSSSNQYVPCCGSSMNKAVGIVGDKLSGVKRKVFVRRLFLPRCLGRCLCPCLGPRIVRQGWGGQKHGRHATGFHPCNQRPQRGSSGR